jgi:nucleoid-associated protein YgaU
MKNVIVCCVLLGMFFMSGCVMRTYTTEIDRVDQEISGNRGVIMGTPPAVTETEPVKKTRTVYNMEIELPSGYRTSQEIEDKDLYGNRGYVQGSVSPEKEVYLNENGKESVSGAGLGSSKMPQIVYSEPSSDAGINAGGAQKEYYVVQNGDTLQKISQKLFGTSQKWQSIYDANRRILKSPDRIRSGQKLVIPK